MESPRKFNDCYFYYYSTCTKGDSCVFRHEPSALGCETMCVQWQQGKCLDKHCKLRHMELRKNRKQIPCYWESQPGGCRKKHCPFQHKNPEARTDGILPSQPIPQTNKTVATPGNINADAEPALVAAPAPVPAPLPPPHAAHVSHPANAASMVMPHHEMMWQQQRGPVVIDSAILGVLPPTDMLGRRAPPHDGAPQQYAALPVDPLVVSFEEESDNESAPSSTPTKMVCAEEGPMGGRGKSQELLLLEQIQAAAAAYYSYEPAPAPAPSAPYERRSLDELSGRPRTRTSLDFKILSLDEIRARKRLSDPAQLHLDDTKAGRKRKLSSHDTILAPNKVLKVVRNNSVVYKKLNGNTVQGNDATNIPEDADCSQRRTFSVQSDDDELDDSLKAMSTNLPPSKIKQIDISDKPKEIKLKLIHTHSESEMNSCGNRLSDEGLDMGECGSGSDMCGFDDDEIKSVVDLDIATTAQDKESETIILSDEDSKLETDDIEEVTIIDSPIRVAITNEKESNGECKEINLKKTKHYEEGVEEIVVDVEREDSSNDSITPEIEKSLKTVIVPDVVASCHSNTFDTTLVQNEDEDKVLSEINSILSEESL